MERAVRFHTALVDASHNPLLIELYRAMTESVARGIQQATADPEPADVGTASHEDLLAAVAAHDPDAAAATAARHLAPLIAQIRAQLQAR